MLRVAAETEPRYWIGFVLAVMTGMRKGEILALRWSDIDLDAGNLHIQRTLTFIEGKPVFQEPKTHRSRRQVDLPADAIDALRKHRNRQTQERWIMEDEYHDNDLIIARSNGNPVNARTFDDAWYRILKRVDAPKIRFHDLHHTHASLLLQMGVHPKVVSERLGHATVNITLGTYSHVLPGIHKQVADDFGDLLRRSKHS